jgi:hypothetical protein
MSNPSTPTAASVSGRPAVPPQSRTLGRAEPNTVNPRFNAVHSPAEYVKELARYYEAKDRASFNAAIEALRKKRSHHGNGNGNYNDSNPDDPDAQHREHVRSSPSSQLPSPTLANPNGQASQNSVLQTPLNNEYLLAYNKYLVPNSEFARVHQQMIQERRQQQLAREEAAELRERVRTALAKASSRPDLDQADPLPVPTTGGSPGGGSTAPISTKPGSAAASQPLNQTLVKNLVPNSEFARVHQQMIQEAKAKAIAATPVSAQQQPGEGSLVVPLQPGEGSLVVPQQPGEGSDKYIEGQGLSMPIIAIAASPRPDLDQANPNSVPQTNQNSVPQTSNTLAHQANPIKQLPNSTSKCRKSIQKSTKNFQKRSKFSRQKFGKFRQISMSKNVIRMVLGRLRKNFPTKTKFQTKFQ